MNVRVQLINKGGKIISALTLECDADQSVFFSDGCCMLLPNESVVISLDYLGDKQPTLFVSGLGVPYRRL